MRHEEINSPYLLRSNTYVFSFIEDLANALAGN